jgi:hypothetical protein
MPSLFARLHETGDRVSYWLRPQGDDRTGGGNPGDKN